MPKRYTCQKNSSDVCPVDMHGRKQGSRTGLHRIATRAPPCCNPLEVFMVPLVNTVHHCVPA